MGEIEYQPYLFEYMFTFNDTLSGKLLRFKLKATNEIGSTISEDYLQILLAGIPAKPTDVVSKVSSDIHQIIVLMPLASDNGGTTLQAY